MNIGSTQQQEKRSQENERDMRHLTQFLQHVTTTSIAAGRDGNCKLVY